jgi:hypothetical protein
LNYIYFASFWFSSAFEVTCQSGSKIQTSKPALQVNENFMANFFFKKYKGLTWQIDINITISKL